MTTVRLLSAFALPLLVAACGGKGNPGFGGASDAGMPMPTGGANADDAGAPGPVFAGDDDAGAAPADPRGCSAAAKLVYVLSDANELYAFDPPAKTMTRIGVLGCAAAQGMTPNSMAVDRDAVAWVNYAAANGVTAEDTAGALYKVSTKDASCEGPYMKLPAGWYRLGMGFATDAAGSTAETLYVTATPSGGILGGGGGDGLARIDLAQRTIAPVGKFTGALAGQSAELTGTGDGRLFGFFTTSPVRVAEIDKASAAIVGTPASIAGVERPIAWAFSFWGGDFWLYTAPDPTTQPGRTSNVTRYRPQDGSADTGYLRDVGFRIVGAGVSTCAPVASPR